MRRALVVARAATGRGLCTEPRAYVYLPLGHLISLIVVYLKTLILAQANAIFIIRPLQAARVYTPVQVNLFTRHPRRPDPSPILLVSIFSF